MTHIKWLSALVSYFWTSESSLVMQGFVITSKIDYSVDCDLDVENRISIIAILCKFFEKNYFRFDSLPFHDHLLFPFQNSNCNGKGDRRKFHRK